MARAFDDASNEYLLYSGAVVTVAPFALACWIFADDGAIDHAGVCVGDTDALSFHRLQLRSTNVAQMNSRLAGVNAFADTTTSWTTNTWHHICGIVTAGNNRSVFLDGEGKGTNATNVTPTNLDNTTIGVLRANSSFYSYASGRIAEAAIWDLSHWPGSTDAARAGAFERVAVPLLAGGERPSFFPAGLVAYWPLVYPTNEDWAGRYNMTAYNSPTNANHPPQVNYDSMDQPVFVPRADIARQFWMIPFMSLEEPAPAVGPILTTYAGYAVPVG